MSRQDKVWSGFVVSGSMQQRQRMGEEEEKEPNRQLPHSPPPRTQEVVHWGSFLLLLDFCGR
jgi:hypothetical protein